MTRVSNVRRSSVFMKRDKSDDPYDGHEVMTIWNLWNYTVYIFKYNLTKIKLPFNQEKI